MSIWTPGWMQNGTFTAQMDRNLGSPADLFDEGVFDRTSLKVSQRGAGANMSVDVAAGKCIVQGDDQTDQGSYTVYSDAVFNLTGFVASSSNTRYDIVVMQVNDPNAGGAAGDNAVIVRVAGSDSATPVIPTIPDSALLLAVVGPFTTSTSSITDAMIHDCFTGTGPTGVEGARLLRGFRDVPGTSKETYQTVASNGWLMEYGQAVSRTTYARLFAEIGTTHGVGDGSTTFNLPNSRGCVAVALDNMGGTDAGRLPSSVTNALGGVGGSADAVAVDHDHVSFNVAIKELAITKYGMTGPDAGAIELNHIMGFSDFAAGSARNLAIDIPASTGETGAGKNLQPFILVNRMIRT